MSSLCVANLVIEPAKEQIQTSQDSKRFNKRHVCGRNRTDHQLLQPGTLKLTRTPYATHSPFATVPKEDREDIYQIQTEYDLSSRRYDKAHDECTTYLYSSQLV